MTFRKELRQALDGQEVLPDEWATTASVIRETGRRALDVSSGREVDKTLWLAKKKWDIERTEECRWGDAG